MSRVSQLTHVLGASTLSKIKRRNVIVVHDENTVPDAGRRGEYVDHNDALMQIDFLSELDPSSRKSQNAAKIPVKHEQRFALSPTGINARYKTTTVGSTHFNGCEVQKIPTPQTPRRRDALSKRIPTTPRHRVNVTGLSVTPHTPRTPSTPSTLTRSVYNDARKIFTPGANSGPLVGRVNERRELHDFIFERVMAVRGGCIYVSGPPGTGKSALVNEICQDIKNKFSVKHAYINCMSVKTAADIYRGLASELSISDDVFGNDAKDMLKTKLLEKCGTTAFLVTLDEIDQLLNLDHDVLYSLFEWSFQKGSKLTLIGIANALDLTDRFLPRLKARNLKPQLLPFLPYTAPEIASVLTFRARSLLPENSNVAANYTPFLHPAAIQLISKKVASQSGDLRKAFDIARRAVDLIEIETRETLASKVTADIQTQQPSPSRTPLTERLNFSSPSSMRSSSPVKTNCPTISLNMLLAQLDTETAPRATLAHVVRVTSSTFGNGTSQRLGGMNLQQKAVLCSLVALTQRNHQPTNSPPHPTNKKRVLRTPSKSDYQASTAAPTIRTVFESYKALCKRDDLLHALSNTEFRDVIGNLETLSLIASVDGRSLSLSAPATPSKRGRNTFGGMTMLDERRVFSCVGLKEMDGVLQGAGSGILKNILSGDGFN